MTVETSGSTYFIDPNNPAEMTRLRKQDTIFTEAMGGLLAHLPTDGAIHSVLDIACGPGGWVLNLAFEHPEMEVAGIDISKPMITYASTQARVQNRQNASFQVMDATQPLNFADATFDLVNARLISTFLKGRLWSSLLAESRRILKPGGILRIIDFERALTNSPAHERISSLLTQCLHQRGLGFSPDGSHVGVLPVLARLMHSAGFEQIQEHMFHLNYSFGSPAHNEWAEDLQIMLVLTQPLIVNVGLASEKEVQHLYERVMVEMANPEFCALTPCITVVGTKPDAHK